MNHTACWSFWRHTALTRCLVAVAIALPACSAARLPDADGGLGATLETGPVQDDGGAPTDSASVPEWDGAREDAVAEPPTGSAPDDAASKGRTSDGPDALAVNGWDDASAESSQCLATCFYGDASAPDDGGAPESATIVKGGAPDGGPADATLDGGSNAEDTWAYSCNVPPERHSGDGGAATLLTHFCASGVPAREGDRIMVGDTLWDVARRAPIWRADPGFTLWQGIISGGVFAVADATGAIQIRSSGDGSLLGTLHDVANGLSRDGTYLYGATASGLSAWATSGAPLVQRMGDYNDATVLAAPGALRVTGGPAGLSVIETIPLDGGASTFTPLPGDFGGWFDDASAYFVFTNASQSSFSIYDAQMNWVHSDTLVPDSQGRLPALNGWSHYYCTVNIYGGLRVYDLNGADGGAQVFDDTANYSNGFVLRASLFRAPHFFRVSSPPPWGNDEVDLVDLSGPQIKETKVPAPYPNIESLGCDLDGRWAAVTQDGVLYYHGTVADPARQGHLTCGVVQSLAGSPSGTAALAMASGDILLVDVNTGTFLPPISAAASAEVSLSDDGHVLAAVSYVAPGASDTDRSATIFDVRSRSVISDYPAQMDETLIGLRLSASGTQVSRVYRHADAGTYPDVYNHRFVVTDLAKQSTILNETAFSNWADPLGLSAAPLMSPNGRNIAIAVGLTSLQTNFYQNGSLVATQPGIATGWTDDATLLVQEWDTTNPNYHFVHMVAFDPLGNSIGVWPTVLAYGGVPFNYPELNDIVRGGEVYSRYEGIVYAPKTGTVLETVNGPQTSYSSFPFPPPGAAAGAQVIYVVQNGTIQDSIRAVPF